MPKKYSRRSMKGGMFESWSQSLTSGWNSLSQNSKSWWEKLKSPTSSYGTPSSVTSSSYGTPSSVTSSSYGTPSSGAPSSYGGKKRKTGYKKMHGGDFSDNTPTSGLAFHAAPFSGETARPNTWVGGKTKKRRKHSKRSKSHRKH